MRSLAPPVGVGFDTARPNEGAITRQYLAKVAVACWREWRLRSRSRAELTQMDERMLRDVGLSHGEALFEAGKPFWRA
jgi:uncharacterized protein YjiS (DUF1127 family)